MGAYIISSSSPVLLLVSAIHPFGPITWVPSDRLGLERRTVFRFSADGNLHVPDGMLLHYLTDTEMVKLRYSGTRVRIPYYDHDVRVIPVDGNNPMVSLYFEGLRSSHMIDEFSVYPLPGRGYTQIVDAMLESPMPRVEVLFGEYVATSSDVYELSEIDWADPDLVTDLPLDEALRSSRVYLVRSGRHGSKMGIVVRRKLLMEYDTVLHMLWDLPSINPLGGFSLSSILKQAIVVRFTDRSNRDYQTIIGIKHPFSRGLYRPIRRTAYMLPDTLAMLAGLLGYYRMPMNEIAYLMLGWWNIAVTGIGQHVTYPEVKRTSALLMSDMLRRMDDTEFEMVMSMLEKLKPNRQPRMRNGARGGVVIEGFMDFNSKHETEHVKFRFPSACFPYDQYELLKVWNLVRSQLGIPTISRENYTPTDTVRLYRSQS